MKSEDFKQCKELIEKILKSRNGMPLLMQYNVNLICGVIKKFLIDLNDPLITKESWKIFSRTSSKFFLINS